MENQSVYVWIYLMLLRSREELPNMMWVTEKVSI